MFLRLEHFSHSRTAAIALFGFCCLTVSALSLAALYGPTAASISNFVESDEFLSRWLLAWIPMCRDAVTGKQRRALELEEILAHFAIPGLVYWWLSAAFMILDVVADATGNVERWRISFKGVRMEKKVDWQKYQFATWLAFQNNFLTLSCIFLFTPLWCRRMMMMTSSSADNASCPAMVLFPSNNVTMPSAKTAFPVVERFILLWTEDMKNIFSSSSVAIHFVFLLVLWAAATDVIFFTAHYCCHQTIFGVNLYALIHRTHHTFTQSYGVAAVAAHAVEHLVCNDATAELSPIVAGLPFVHSTFFLCVAAFTTVLTHSGFDLPFVTEHTAHHRFPTQNVEFGVAFFMDRLFGTTLAAFEERKSNKKKKGSVERSLSR